ncbi:MAG: DUF4328 domain-containing protein [Prevotellaceae bacterium]|jgi:hypothetical protein|nr:DUF4328 domain-containing protein [Prevotellaceae bacterium]
MKLKSNAQRAKNAILLTWIVLGLTVISLFSSYMQYDLLQIAVNDGYITEEQANANDNREAFIGIVLGIASIVFLIIFIMWFRRAYYNIHQKLNSRRLTFSEGWAAGAWFVPIINLFRPYQIMKELYYETKKLLTDKGYTVSYTTNCLGWWWALWIISVIIGQVLFRTWLKQPETLDEFISATTLDMVSSVVEIVLAIVTIKVIKDYSLVEPLLFEINDENEKTIVGE